MSHNGGDRAAELSEQAKQLYAAICGQEWELAHALEAEHPGIRQQLIIWGLVSEETLPTARDPQYALRAMVTRVLAAAREHIELVETMPELSRDLIQSYRQVQLNAGGSSVYLDDQDKVNARLTDLVAGARREILAAQPGGPRSRELLELAVARDSKALDRGVELRTIYRDTVRDHAVTAEYARTMSARPGGRPARYATLVGDFERMILVDRQIAVVQDHIVEGSPPHSAWLITDPAVVAVLAAVYDATWRRAQPWTGELRSRARTGVDTVSSADGIRTDRRQRGILRYLCAGHSQEATARQMGVSKRKLQEEIAVLKARWGVDTLLELAYQYALSPDNLVDDSAPAGDAAGAEDGLAA